MTVTEAVNRGNNLLATSIVTLSGFAFLPEAFVEDEWWHKLDDAFLFLLGIRAIVWYVRGNHKFTRSVLPVIFVIAALGIKILGLILEFGDKEDMGDEFGGLILFVLATILVIWTYKKLKPSEK